MSKFALSVLASVIVTGLMAFLPHHVSAQQLQMLPPTNLNAPSTVCTGGNTVLAYSADPAPGHSAINCVPGFTADATGSVNMNSTLYINQAWGTRDQMFLDANQISNKGGDLYLNYSAPNNHSIIIGGGASNTQSLSVANGNISVAGVITLSSTWGTSDALTINANQVSNAGGDLYLNWGGPSGDSVTIGGNSPSQVQNLNIPNGEICLNGNCTRNFAPQGCHIVSQKTLGGSYVSDARCASNEYVMSGGAIVNHWLGAASLCPGDVNQDKLGFVHTSVPDADLQGWSVDAYRSDESGEVCTVAIAVCCPK